MPSSTAANLPIADPSALSSMAEFLDDESLEEIVLGCLADATEKSALIVDASATENWQEASQFAHDIKSTAGQMGAARLRDIAIQLEAICKGEDTREALALVQDLKAATEATLHAFAPDLLPGILSAARKANDG